ncbi:Uncharacterised protein [Yersinia enterocolitica]|nr:Uncharacterised protein [Yersinia enterocolitica]
MVFDQNNDMLDFRDHLHIDTAVGIFTGRGQTIALANGR